MGCVAETSAQFHFRNEVIIIDNSVIEYGGGQIHDIEKGKLTQHSREFEKKIYKVADGVYSAVGYGIANSIMLVGKDGVIIKMERDARESQKSHHHPGKL